MHTFLNYRQYIVSEKVLAAVDQSVGLMPAHYDSQKGGESAS